MLVNRQIIEVSRLSAIALLFTLATPAQAYMGAGAGLSAIGSVLSFLAILFLMIFGFVWYPLKRLLKRMRGEREESEPENSE